MPVAYASGDAGSGERHRRGSFAASVYYSSGYGTSVAFGYSSGHHAFGLGYGATPFCYSYAPSPFYATCYAPCYAAAWYAPTWYGPCWTPAAYNPVWYPSYSYCSPSWAGFSYFSSNWRFSVGFGHAYSPSYAYDPCW